MRKFYQILIIIILLPLCIQASGKLDFLTLDKETYRFYREQKWDSLIELGNEGLKQGFDYYYLRYRLGVAYYEMHNYGKASKHFEKAFDFSREDNSLIEYLYYSNVLMNRIPKAEFYADMLPADSKKNLLYTGPSAIKTLDLEAGIILSNDREQNPSSGVWTDSSSYLEHHYAGNRLFARGGFKLQLSARTAINAAYTRLSAAKESSYRYYSKLQIDTIISTPFTNDYYYSFAEINRNTTSTIRQNEVYLRLDLLLGHNWLLSPFIHYLGVNYSREKVKYIPKDDSAVLYFDKTTEQYHYFDYVRNIYRFNTKDTLLNDYVTGISLSRQFALFTLKVSASAGSLNLKKRYGLSGDIGYFPLGNLNLYGSTSFSFFTTDNNQQQNDNNYHFSQTLGVKVLDFVWMEGDFMIGSIENTWKNDASVVYNVPDEVNYIAGAGLIILISPQLQLNLRYQYWQKEGAAIHYFLDELKQSHNEMITTTYQNHMITGGLTWKL